VRFYSKCHTPRGIKSKPGTEKKASVVHKTGGGRGREKRRKFQKNFFGGLLKAGSERKQKNSRTQHL
jgi:hypothetical protein